MKHKTSKQLARYTLVVYLGLAALVTGFSAEALAKRTHCESKNFENIFARCEPVVAGQNDCTQDEFACKVETYTANACVAGGLWCAQLADMSTVSTTITVRKCDPNAGGACICNFNGYEYSHYSQDKQIFECAR